MIDLILASMFIAVVHSFAPDHYLPYVAIGRARNWSGGKIIAFSGLASTLHVLSSATFGFLLLFGIDMLGIAESVERTSSLLLIAFGIIYAVFSILMPHRHLHPTSVVFLLALGLSPCIPLIPLMLASEKTAPIVVLSFGVTTVITVIFLTYMSSKALKPPEILHGKEDFAAGIVITLTGILSYVWNVRMKVTKLKAMSLSTVWLAGR